MVKGLFCVSRACCYRRLTGNYVNRYAQMQAPVSYYVKFSAYDGTINQPPKELAEASFDSDSQIN